MEELIIGLHSIEAVIRSRPSDVIQIYATETGLDELLKKTQFKKSALPPLTLLAPHALQEKGKQFLLKMGLEPQRIPSQIFIISKEKNYLDFNQLKDLIKGKEHLQGLALDNISDVNNGAAILRTAAFFQMDFILLPSEKSFGFTPSFFRIASGATEYLNIVRVSSMPRALASLREDGIRVIGLSEHAKLHLADLKIHGKTVLVLGTEDVGLSNAVQRNVDDLCSLPSASAIKSLNVSAAAAIAMQICYPLKSK